MSKVACLRCKEVYEVPFSRLLFSPLHLLLVHVIYCPHCGRYTWHRHLMGESEQADDNLALGGTHS